MGVLNNDVALELDVAELVAGGVLVVLEDGVSLGVAVGSESLEVELLGAGGEAVPNTGPVLRVGVPADVDVPVGVGVPEDLVGLGDLVVGAGVLVLLDDGAAPFGFATTTGAPGKWVRVLGGTKDGTWVDRSRVAWSREVPESGVGSMDHGVEASVDCGGADADGGPATDGAACSPQKLWVTWPN